MAENDVTIRVGAHDTSSASLDDLRGKLDEIGRKAVEATVGVKDKAALYAADRIRVRLDELSRKLASPKISLSGIAKAELEMERLNLQLDKLGSKSVTVRIREAVTGALAKGLGAGAGRAGKGLGIFAGGAGALAAAAPLGAAGAAVGAFGAIAIPVLTKVHAAQTALTKAQEQYAQATTKSQRAAALKAEEKATAGLTSSQKAMMGPLGQLSKLWGKLENAMSPLITDVVKVGTHLLSDLMPAIKTLAGTGGNLLETLLGSLDQFVRTPFFAKFIGLLSQTASAIAPLIGRTLVSLLKLLAQLFISLMPSGVKILSALLPAISQLATSLVPVVTWVAKIIAAVVGWLGKTHLLVPVLFALGAAITAGFGPLGIAITLILLVIRYHNQIWAVIKRVWGDIWTFIKRIWDDIWNFAKQWWPLLLGPTGLIIKYHTQIWDFIKRIWNDIWGFLKRLWNDIENFAKSLWNGVVSFFRDVWTRIWDGIKSAWNAISGWFRSFFNREISGWKTIWNAVTGFFRGLWDKVWNGAKNAWSTIVGWFRGLPGRILGALSGLGTSLWNFGHMVLTKFWNGLKSVWNAIKNFFTSLPKQILGWLGIHSPPDWAIEAGKHIMHGLGIGMTRAHAAVAKATRGMRGAVSGALGGDAAANEALARRLFPFPSGMWGDFYNLVMAESGFNRFAMNPSSGAYGIAQALPASKYPFAGQAAGGSHAGAQLSWMFNYIRSRYGNPVNAWAHELANHWYAGGGATSGGLSGINERIGELVRLPTGSTVIPHANSMALLGTGRPAHVVLEVAGGDSDFEKFMAKFIRNFVRVKGGGDVQVAFGRN